MGKVFSTSFPGIEVSVVEHKRLPDCRPEFRCFYKPGFKRITIRVLPNHLFVADQIIYIDFVYPTKFYNIVVKENDETHLHIIEPEEMIASITHRYAYHESKADCDVIIITLRSFMGMVRKFNVYLKHDNERVFMYLHQ